jgi:hypothetical protein
MPLAHCLTIPIKIPQSGKKNPLRITHWKSSLTCARNRLIDPSQAMKCDTTEDLSMKCEVVVVALATVYASEAVCASTMVTAHMRMQNYISGDDCVGSGCTRRWMPPSHFYRW